MTDQFLWIFVPLALLSLPMLGANSMMLFWYWTNTFPWQLQNQLLKQELTDRTVKLEAREEELRSIRDTLLNSLPRSK